MSAIYTVGAPPDAVAWVALALAVATWCAWPWAKRWVLAHPTSVVVGLALAATGLSLVYVHVYFSAEGGGVVCGSRYFHELGCTYRNSGGKLNCH